MAEGSPRRTPCSHGSTAYCILSTKHLASELLPGYPKCRGGARLPGQLRLMLLAEMPACLFSSTFPGQMNVRTAATCLPPPKFPARRVSPNLALPSRPRPLDPVDPVLPSGAASSRRQTPRGSPGNAPERSRAPHTGGREVSGVPRAAAAGPGVPGAMPALRCTEVSTTRRRSTHRFQPLKTSRHRHPQHFFVAPQPFIAPSRHRARSPGHQGGVPKTTSDTEDTLRSKRLPQPTIHALRALCPVYLLY